MCITLVTKARNIIVFAIILFISFNCLVRFSVGQTKYYFPLDHLPISGRVHRASATEVVD